MNKNSREPWDNYFMKIAKQVASRSTCDRNNIGAVIVRERNILSTGYNGSISKLGHCDDVGHMMDKEGKHCVRTVHAETNAIVQAAKNGVKIDNSEIHITASPCWNCFKLIANAGINRIIFEKFYKDARIFEAAKELNIALVSL